MTLRKRLIALSMAAACAATAFAGAAFTDQSSIKVDSTSVTGWRRYIIAICQSRVLCTADAASP